MDTMTKKFEYKGYEFLITVEFNTMTTHGHLNCKRYHTVKVNCINANNWYYYNDGVVDATLEETILLGERTARSWVEKITANSIFDPLKDKLIELGFSNG
jgi:hypothetical protein